MSSAKSKHAQVFEAFDRLCDAPQSEQREALKELERDAPDVAAELAALLELDSDGSNPLTEAVRQEVSRTVERDRVGEPVGRFILLERLGRGGMGTVYSGFDTELERPVAVKLMPKPSEGGDRWLREARAMAKVTHRNVVTVFEAGTHGDEVFIAMERVSGNTLGSWLREVHETAAWTRGERTSEILTVLLGAARGLVAAHDVGLLHRDFKPENVLLDQDNVPHVADFGLARPMDAASQSKTSDDVTSPPSTTALTRSALAGTPAYMSPEQFAQQTLDARSDQFSFCVTAFEALYGQRPFVVGRGLSMPTFGEYAPLPKKPAIPEAVAAVIRRGLEVDPQARFASMREFVQALEAVQNRHRGRWALLGAGTLAVGAIALATMSESASVDPCGHGEERFTAVWSPHHASLLRDAFAPSEVPYRDAVTDEVLRRFDDYGSRWVHAYRDACEATHVRKDQSEALLDLRMQCLQRKLDAVDINVAALTHAGPEAVAHALDVVDRLPDLQHCADPSYLEDQMPLPSDPTQRNAVEEGQRGLEEVRTGLSLRSSDDPLARLDAIETSVKDIEYPRMTAELDLLRGAALVEADRQDEAIEAFSNALVLAQEHGMHDVVSGAASNLGRSYGDVKQDTATAVMLLRVAEASAERGGVSQAERAAIVGDRAWVLAQWNKSDEAIEWAEQAVEMTEAIEGNNIQPRLRARSLLGSCYQAAGRIEDAEATFRDELALALDAYPPEHPILFATNMHLGITLAMQGRNEEATKRLTSAARIAEAAPSIPATMRARVQMALANVLNNTGEHARAYEVASRALATLEKTLGESHPSVAKQLSNMGQMQGALGNLPEAAALHQRSLEIRERVFGPDHVQLLVPLTGIATARIKNGEPERALEHLQRGREIADAHPDEVVAARRHELDFWTGVALYDTQRDTARAYTLIAATRDNADPESRSHAAATKWLEDHPQTNAPPR